MSTPTPCDLEAGLAGELIMPGHPDYERARGVWNGSIDRRPAAIVRCTNPADVAAAVRFAVDEDVYPAIRAGGHNVAGLAMVDDGLVMHFTKGKGGGRGDG